MAVSLCKCLFLLVILSTCSATTRPNIVIIIADDLGWNDVGFHGSVQIPTPNIDSLAYSGVILNNYYVSPLCSPSRSALMTGRHPIHTGMQKYVLNAGEPWGLDLKYKLLPEYLTDLGYSTHAVGKWHLGFYKKEYAPTSRGFKSHTGFWAGSQDYFTHIYGGGGSAWGYDFRRDMQIAKDCVGNYSTQVFADAAVDVINKHDVEEPLFLYFAQQATHSPLQAPIDTINKFKYIKDIKRRTFAAMLSHLDDSVGQVVEALHSKDMLNNTIILFTADNGGPAAGFNSNAASNWPLRGVKYTLWEGGVRGAAALWSPLIKEKKRVSTQMMHIQDWLPTLITAAGGDSSELGDKIDGMDMWKVLTENLPSPRSELLHNIDDSFPYAALRVGDYKLVQGRNYDGKWDSWYGPSGRNFSDLTDERKELIYRDTLQDAWRRSPTHRIMNELGLDLTLEDIERVATAAEVVCEHPVPVNASTSCQPHLAPCVFNIKTDPCEYHNLADTDTNILIMLQDKLQAYNLTAVPPRNKPNDPRSNPVHFDRVWTNWGDYVNVE